MAQIGNMRKDEALHVLSRARALRQPVLLAVYTYWREKRVKRGKPLLRSLQAPTASSDSNPFNVFRYSSAASLHCHGCEMHRLPLTGGGPVGTRSHVNSVVPQYQSYPRQSLGGFLEAALDIIVIGRPLDGLHLP